MIETNNNRPTLSQAVLVIVGWDTDGIPPLGGSHLSRLH